MSELRNDLVTGRAVLVAPARATRPHTVAAATSPTASSSCPFCAGHEDATPPEVYRTGAGAPDTPGWRIRVVPNLYPIVGGAEPGPGGTGAHEVAILDPDHTRDLAGLDDAAARELFRVLRERARTHAAAGLAYVQVLVNHGRAAGASIAHPHAQLLAIDFVPPHVLDALQRFEAGADIVLTDAENARASDGIVRDGEALVWCPWAAANAFETRITTVDAGPRFELAPDEALDSIACATRDVVAALHASLGDVAYNVIVHNAPTRGEHAYHWYVTVIPRVSVWAGFELGTGVFVNTVDPATAAAALRDAMNR